MQRSLALDQARPGYQTLSNQSHASMFWHISRLVKCLKLTLYPCLQICTSFKCHTIEIYGNNPQLYLLSICVTHEISRTNEQYWPISVFNAPRPSKLARKVDGTNLVLSKISCGFSLFLQANSGTVPQSRQQLPSDSCSNFCSLVTSFNASRSY